MSTEAGDVHETVHIELQHRVFERHGLLYERKRGEFSDGVLDGYIAPLAVIERNHFWRLFYSTNGKVNRGFQKKLFQKNDFSDILPATDEALDRLYLGVNVFQRLRREMKPHARIEKDLYGKVFAYIQLFLDQGLTADADTIDRNLTVLATKWEVFIELQRNSGKTVGHRAFIDKATGKPQVTFSEYKYIRGFTFERDLAAFFATDAHNSAEAVTQVFSLPQ